MHASTMSHLIGDLNSTRRYCEQVLAHDPNNALALFKMADVLFQQGKQEEGTALAERSYALAAASDKRRRRPYRTAQKQMAGSRWTTDLSLRSQRSSPQLRRDEQLRELRQACAEMQVKE